MANLAYFIVLMLFALAQAPDGRAASYTYLEDGDLLAGADTVVLATVLERQVVTLAGRIETRYRIATGEVFKGIAAAEITVVVPGGRDRSGFEFRVDGAPQFAAGDEVVLFLVPGENGTYRLSQFFLGAFRLEEAGGRILARRSLHGVLELPAAGKGAGAKHSEAGRVRAADGFVDWLRHGSTGAVTGASYWIDEPAAPRAAQPKYAVFPARWQRFASGQSATWYAHQSGQTGLSGGGYTEFQQALDCWVDDAGSTILYQYGGLTSATAGLQSSDGRSAILFNDPGNEIGGSYNCFSGGVLAVGGYWAYGGHSWDGQYYWTITEGDIVVQDGAGCYFDRNGGANGAEVFAHELGHTLGLDHSGDPDALMYAMAHGDGRGAVLSADDRNGAAYLYGNGALPEPPLPPTGVTASDGVYNDRVAVSWSGAATADQYRLYRSTSPATAGSLLWSGSATAYTDFSAGQHVLYTYRVAACNSGGCSAPSEGDAGFSSPPVPAAPAGVETVRDAGGFMRISWTGSDGASYYRLLAADSASDQGVALYSGPELTFDDYLNTGSVVFYKVLACNLNGCSSAAVTGAVSFRSVVNPGLYRLLLDEH